VTQVQTDPDDLDGEDVPTLPAVVSFDPGGTTGWAIIQVHPECLISTNYPILENILYRAEGQFEMMSEVDQSKAAAELLDQWEGAAFLIEDFILREFSMDRALLSPVRITSHLEWHCYTNYEPRRPVFKQQSQMMLSTVTDDRMRRWGLYNRRSGVHAREATKHAIVFLRRALQSPALRAAAWPHIYGSEGADHARAV
jgi:hypothetical protein